MAQQIYFGLGNGIGGDDMGYYGYCDVCGEGIDLLTDDGHPSFKDIQKGKIPCQSQTGEDYEDTCHGGMEIDVNENLFDRLQDMFERIEKLEKQNKILKMKVKKLKEGKGGVDMKKILKKRK